MAFSLLNISGQDQFEKLAVKVTNMGGLVEGQLADAMSALERRHAPMAKAVIENDERVNRADADIQDIVLKLIENRQSESQSRKVAVALQISNELERVGDLAKNIAKRSLILSGEDLMPASASIIRMGQVAMRQLTGALNALTEESLEMALAVWGGDEHLDGLYNSIFLEVMHEMARAPLSVNAGTHLVFVAKNLERVGDHATNIAEQVYFQCTGNRMDENRPKGDMINIANLVSDDAS